MYVGNLVPLIIMVKSPSEDLGLFDLCRWMISVKFCFVVSKIMIKKAISLLCQIVVLVLKPNKFMISTILKSDLNIC